MLEYLRGIVFGLLLALWTYIMISLAGVAYGATVDPLKCSPGVGGVPATSFQLWRKQPGETEYAIVADMAVCDFPNQTIVDTGETCFKFSAKNENGYGMRNDTTICIDPRLSPVAPPRNLGVN